MTFSGLQRVPGNSEVGGFHYVPVLFEAERHVQKFQRELLEVLGLLLGNVQGTRPNWGIIYHGPDCTMTRVQFSQDTRVARGIMQELLRLQRGELQPRLHLNDHCPTCEFRERCRDQAVRGDSISLLRGLGRKETAAYARKRDLDSHPTRAYVSTTPKGETFRSTQLEGVPCVARTGVTRSSGVRLRNAGRSLRYRTDIPRHRGRSG
jgi:hypothetical protein